MKEPKFTCELCCETYDLDTLIPFDDRLLQRSKNLPKTHIGTDSYVAVQLLEKQQYSVKNPSALQFVSVS